MNNPDEEDDGQHEGEEDGQYEEEKDGQSEESDGQLERICFDCNYFFPDLLLSMPTEFGICLKDEAFEPFIDEMLENENFECCRELVEQKRFDGNCEACGDFEECEIVYREEDFGQEFNPDFQSIRT